MALREDENRATSFGEEIPKDLDRAERLVEEGLLAGAAEAEVYIKTSATTGIFLSQGFTTLTLGSERGIALRVFDGRGNFGHAFSSGTDDARCREMMRAAVGALKEAAEGREGRVFPASRPEEGPARIEGMVDPRVTLWTSEEKRGRLEAALKEASWGRPTGTSATCRDGISRIALANSRGVRSGYVRTLSLATLTRAGNGGPTLHVERVAAGPDPEGWMEAASGLARLQPAGGDEEIDGRDFLLESPAAVGLVRHLLPDLADDRAAGEGPGEIEIRRIASEAVTVVDDGHLPGGVASAPFDGEGNPTGKVTLVKAGVRIDRLRSLRPGEKGRPGSAVRASYRDLPGPGGTNLFVEPGTRPLEELLRDLERGFLLATLEGDLREGRSGRPGTRWRGMGWEVRDGSCVGPCRRLVFLAEPAELLEGILEVSARLRFSLRQGVAVGSPDLLIRRR